MRANINLLPRNDVEYDIWTPLGIGIKPSSDTKINPTENECLEAFAKVKKDEILEIYNNGEPPASGERVAIILRKHGYKNVTVHPGNDKEYFKNPSYLFPENKRPYRIQPIHDLKEKIKTLFEFYKTQTWNIEEPEQGVCGHYRRGKMLWTQIQQGYDVDASTNVPLMRRMKEVLGPVSSMVKQFLKDNHTAVNELDSKITLRLLDYVNKDNLNDTLASHLDASLLTGLLYHDAPALHAVEFTDDSLTIENAIRRDITKEVLDGNCFWIPGYVYADEMKSYVSPCWHGVQVPAEYSRRLSMIVRVECELIHNGIKMEIPGYYWNDKLKTWCERSKTDVY